MSKTKFINVISDIFESSKLASCMWFLGFAIFFTLLLCCKYFLLQTIITPDGISKRDIKAYKTIEVVDVLKTEQQKKEVSQRISPILTPTEDSYIKNNLSVLEKSVFEIRDKISDTDSQRPELPTLFDIKETSRKQLIINYLLTAPKSDVSVTFKKASQTLDDILKAGVTEEDFNSNIDRIIFKHIKHDIVRNKIAIISGILEQVIVPNLVIDEKATYIAKQNAANSVKPVIVRFEKDDKIVFAGEPVTKLKRDALNQAGYNVLELNWKGVLAIFAFVLTGIISLVYYMHFFYKSYLTKNYLSIIAVLAIFMGLFAIIIPDNENIEKISEFILPFPAFAMLVTSFINSRVSIVVSTILLMVLGISMQFSMPVLVIFSIIIVISSIAVSRIKYTRRVDLIKTGIEISVAMVFLILSSYVLQSCINSVDVERLIADVQLGFINGIISGVVVLGVIPVLESMFKIITPYGLAEYGETNHPLLKRLQESAPGTFSHSLMVSNLCEAAAEAIVADPILAKVGAL